MFKIDTRDINRLERDLGKIAQKHPVATSRAINRTFKSTRDAAGKEISQKTGLALRKKVMPKLTIREANKGDLTAIIDARDARDFNLIASLPPKSRKPSYFNRKLKSGKRRGQYAEKGVKTKAKTFGTSPRVYERTFIIDSRNGPLVVSQASKGFNFVHGPSVRKGFESSRSVMMQQVKTRLPIDLEREINAEINRLIARRSRR